MILSKKYFLLCFNLELIIYENNYDFTFGLRKSNSTTGLKIDIFDARVESQSFNLSIGDNMSFSSEFSFKIYPEDGMRLSGAARLI